MMYLPDERSTTLFSHGSVETQLDLRDATTEDTWELWHDFLVMALDAVLASLLNEFLRSWQRAKQVN